MRHVGPMLVLAIATIALTWPLAAHLADAYPGYTRIADDDLLVNVWSLWWTRASLLEGRGGFFFTRYLFYPDGVTLTLTAICPVASLAVLPVLKLLPGLAGVELAWNLNVLATFWLSGVGAYLLAERVTGERWAALVGGLVFAFSPYRYEHLRHVNLSCTQWLPFVFLGLEAGGWRLEAAALALVIASSTTYTAQLPLFLAVYGVFWVIAQEDRRAAARRFVGALPVPVALGVLLAAPALLPALADLATTAFEAPVWDDPMNFSFPIESFFTPNLTPYVGVIALALAVRAVVRVKGSGPWAAVAFLGLALAPGPWLKTSAGVTSIPLPYAFVRYFPGLGQNRFTERFLVFWWLGAAVLAAQAIASWRPYTRSPRTWALVIGALAMLDVRQAPIALERPEVPAIYAELARAPADWPVYEWPADYLTNRRFMYYQMVHQRPICQGVLSRRPLASYQAEEVDALSQLPNMILVLHHDVTAQPHIQHKLEVLRRRYDVKPFAKDGPIEALLLTLKR